MLVDTGLADNSKKENPTTKNNTGENNDNTEVENPNSENISPEDNKKKKWFRSHKHLVKVDLNEKIEVSETQSTKKLKAVESPYEVKVKKDEDKSANTKEEITENKVNSPIKGNIDVQSDQKSSTNVPIVKSEEESQVENQNNNNINHNNEINQEINQEKIYEREHNDISKNNKKPGSRSNKKAVIVEDQKNDFVENQNNDHVENEAQLTTEYNAFDNLEVNNENKADNMILEEKELKTLDFEKVSDTRQENTKSGQNSNQNSSRNQESKANPKKFEASKSIKDNLKRSSLKDSKDIKKTCNYYLNN